jgi:hypothetical protein
MKVSIVRGGGVAGLVTTTAIDSDSLSAEQARALTTQVEEAGVFDLPPQLIGEADHPDQLTYSLTVEDVDRAHTVVMTEDALPESIRTLISWVESSPARQESIGSASKET